MKHWYCHSKNDVALPQAFLFDRQKRQIFLPFKARDLQPSRIAT
jgi:hypothetical protein